MPHRIYNALMLPDSNTKLSVTYSYDADDGTPVTHVLNITGENAEFGPHLMAKFREFLVEKLGFKVEAEQTKSVSPREIPALAEAESAGRFHETTIEVSRQRAVVPFRTPHEGYGTFMAAASLIGAVKFFSHGRAVWDFLPDIIQYLT